jgi:hypothetical protein
MRHPRPLTAALLVTLLAAPAAALAQADPAQPATPPARCSAPEQRQFDFWIGEWEVRTPDGKLAGTNRIEKALDGCTLEESWQGVSGTRGQSFNSWDAQRKRWHQTWVDNNGLVLQLDGGLRDGKMVLSGEQPDPEGGTALQRIPWTPLPDSGVQQTWDVSKDGKSWETIFDGFYSRKK